MSLHDLVTVNLYTKTRLLRQVDASAYDLHRLFGQALTALLPDPVSINTVHLARDCCCTLYNHSQGDIEVVIGMAAPHQTEVVAQLTYTYGTFHGPEVRIC